MPTLPGPMSPIVHPLVLALRVLTVTQLALGGALWAGAAGAWRPLHLGLGGALGLTLVALGAAVSATTRRPGALLLARAWTALLVAYGIGHVRLRPGGGHGTVQVAHLLIGLATLGIAERVVGRGAAHATRPARRPDARLG